MNYQKKEMPIRQHHLAGKTDHCICGESAENLGGHKQPTWIHRHHYVIGLNIVYAAWSLQHPGG